MTTLQKFCSPLLPTAFHLSQTGHWRHGNKGKTRKLFWFSHVFMYLRIKNKFNTARITTEQGIVMNAPRTIYQKGGICLPFLLLLPVNITVLACIHAATVIALMDFVSHQSFFWLHLLSETLLEQRQTFQNTQPGMEAFF